MLLLAIIFIGLGILIKNGKKHNLIAGYNSKSEEDKAKINIDKLAILMRNVLFGMAFVFIIGFFLVKWTGNKENESITLFGGILIGIPYLLFKSNSDKYIFK